MRRRLEKGTLGVVAGSSLTVTELGVGLSRVVRGAIESDLFFLAIAALANVVVESPIATAGLSWLVLLTALYTYTDYIFFNRASDLTSSRGFRLLTTGSAGGLGFFVMQGGFFSPRFGTDEYLWRILLLQGLIVCSFSLYLRFSRGEFFARDGAVV